MQQPKRLHRTTNIQFFLPSLHVIYALKRIEIPNRQGFSKNLRDTRRHSAETACCDCHLITLQETCMKFWKFQAPSGDQMRVVLASTALPPQTQAAGLEDTYSQVVARLRPSDCLVLGELVGEEGKIVGFGRVQKVGITADEFVIQWVAGSHGVHPTGSGLSHWRSKTAFEISPLPAERYGLRGLLDYYLKT